VFEHLGATVDEACPDLDDADEVFEVLRAWIFVASFGEVVARHPDQVKQAIRWNVEQGRRLSGEDIARAETLHTQLHQHIVEFFTGYDVLLAPTTQVVPFDVGTEYPAQVEGVHQDSYLGWMRSCSMITAAGVPALSVPAGFTEHGLPVGLQIIGAPRADRQVLEVGHAFEQVTGVGRRRPDLTILP